MGGKGVERGEGGEGGQGGQGGEGDEGDEGGKGDNKLSCQDVIFDILCFSKI